MQIAADSTCQCERLAAETTPERDARFECDSKTWGTTNCSVVAASFSAAFHPNQDA